MRTPVYRNLDRPFKIFGLNVFELVVLCIVFVLGGEISQTLGIHRIWSFLLIIILAFSFVWIRHTLGDFFIQHFIRFLKLPKTIYPKLLELNTINTDK